VSPLQKRSVLSGAFERAAGGIEIVSIANIFSVSSRQCASGEEQKTMMAMDGITGDVLKGSYDYRLVALSVTIAALASYAALDLAGRVTSAQGRARTVWLSGGATAMGIGIWSMHYVGMLAFRLPVVVLYDWPPVGVSLLAAILASAIALFVVSRSKMGIAAPLTGSVCMGATITGMHYIGMAAMRLPAPQL